MFGSFFYTKAFIPSPGGLMKVYSSEFEFANVSNIIWSSDVETLSKTPSTYPSLMIILGRDLC